MSKPTQKKTEVPGLNGEPPPEQVLICGLGLGLAQVTLETLQALKRCSTVFHCFLDKKTAAYVRTLCPEVRDLGKLSAAGGPGAAEDAVLAAAAPGRTVAFLHYGHPMVFQEDLLVKRCKAANVPYRVLAALSSLDAVLVAIGIPPLKDGLQVRRADAVGRGAPLLPESHALILALDRLWDPRNAGVPAFVKYLGTVYPPGHWVKLIHCPDITDAGALREGTQLRALAGALKGLRAAARNNTSLFIPSPENPL